MLNLLYNSKSIPEFRDGLDAHTEEKGYRGVAGNFIFADTSGNIAYQMGLPIYRRKVETPYLGCRVLDGRTS